jgi:hypothetical protein
MTFLQILNLVLLRLREDQVEDSDETEYSQLIRQFINEAKHDIEDAWDFNTQRHSIRIFTEAGNAHYMVGGVGADLRVLEAWNATEGFEMEYGEWRKMNRMGVNEIAHGVQRNCPRYIDRDGLDDFLNPVFEVFPVPDGVYEIILNAIIKQEEYTQVAQDGYLIEIPSNPLILGAYNRAVEERGDDSSARLGLNLTQYENALRRSIASDQAQQQEANQWELD